ISANNLSIHAFLQGGHFTQNVLISEHDSPQCITNKPSTTLKIDTGRVSRPYGVYLAQHSQSKKVHFVILGVWTRVCRGALTRFRDLDERWISASTGRRNRLP